MEKIAACTIVSSNYISYARTLGDSFKKTNPDKDFYILLVDKYNGCLDDYVGSHKIIEVSELNIQNFRSIAFKFDILELNTNVKPSFLKYLLQKEQYDKVIYFDPDIYVYRDVKKIVDILSKYSLVVIPHCISSYPDDGLNPNDQELLQTGVFNLGFIAVSNHEKAIKFLDWWEKKCLNFGFNETRNGLFVDQKWVNYIPCFSDSVYILKDPGYNMAYWNLHERFLEMKEGQYIVNKNFNLVFFHFSGIDANKPNLISKHQSRYDFIIRKDLTEIFNDYRKKLVDNGVIKSKSSLYCYSKFSNGANIPSLVRRLYSQYENHFLNEDPFNSDGSFYRWIKENHMRGEKDSSGKYNSNNYDKDDIRLTILHSIFKLLLRVLGVDKYTILMKYLSWISILRNQKEIFKL